MEGESMKHLQTNLVCSRCGIAYDEMKTWLACPEPYVNHKWIEKKVSE